MEKRPKPGPRPLHLPRTSEPRSCASSGDWVVVATFPLGKEEPHTQRVVHGVAVLEGAAARVPYQLRRYPTKEEAMALACHHSSAVRTGGGWILNLRTGETVRVEPMR